MAAASDDVPEALAVALHERGLGDSWAALEDRDRLRYARWVAKARGPRAKRRAKTVGDRVADGRGWRGPVRRVLENLFGIPKGTTAADIDMPAARWPQP